MTDAPIHAARLPDFGKFGTRSCMVSERYEKDDEKINNEKMSVLIEREKEEMDGKYDQFEYMQHFNWPDKKLKKSSKIEKLFKYDD